MSQTEALAIFGALMVVLAVLGIVVDWIGKPLRNRKFVPRIYRYADEHMVELDPSRTAFSEAPFMLPSAAPQGVPYVDASGVSDWAQSHFVLPDPDSAQETWGVLTSADPTAEHAGFAELLHVDTLDTYEQAFLLGQTVPMPPPSLDDTVDFLPPPPPQALDGLAPEDSVDVGMSTQELPSPPPESELAPPPEDDAEHWFDEALSEADEDASASDEPDGAGRPRDAFIPTGALDTAPVPTVATDDTVTSENTDADADGDREDVDTEDVDTEDVDTEDVDMKDVDTEDVDTEDVASTPIDVGKEEVIEVSAVESEPVIVEVPPEAKEEPEFAHTAAASDASAGPTTESTLFADLVNESPADAVKASTFAGLVDAGAGPAAAPRPLLTPEQATSEPGVWQPGDPLWTPTAKGTKPSPTLVRRRFWQSAAVLIPGIRWYGMENVTRMADGNPPRRRNRRNGKLESMQITGLRSSDDRTISRPYWPGNEPDPFELY